MTQYVLHPDCRVRREEFGLLFYDLKGPKLLFVASGDLVEPDAFRPGSAASLSLAAAPRRGQRRVAALLQALAEKGFIRAAAAQ